MILNTVLFLSLFLCSLHHFSSAHSLAEEKEILAKIYANEKINTFIRPYRQNETAGPVVTKVNMYLRSISNLDENDMSYNVQLTFRLQWNDNRLSYEAKDLKYVTVLDTSKLWTPDLFFSNEKEAHFHDVLTPNILIRIWPNGDILYSTRLSLKLNCKMDLSGFPMDTQICSIIMASYGYTSDDLLFLWKEEDPVQFTKVMTSPDFDMTDFETDYCNSKTNTGEYSCLKLNMKFSRKWSYYMTRIYLPFAFFVILSWIPFWMSYKDFTAKVTIWVSIFLVMAITSAGVINKIPKKSCTMAIDVWTGVCWTFLFGVIIEFVVIAQIALREEKDSDDSKENSLDSKFGKVSKWLNRYPSKIQKIDVISRVIFPIAFGMFNIIYWSVYAI